MNEPRPGETARRTIARIKIDRLYAEAEWPGARTAADLERQLQTIRRLEAELEGMR